MDMFLTLQDLLLVMIDTVTLARPGIKNRKLWTQYLVNHSIYQQSLISMEAGIGSRNTAGNNQVTSVQGNLNMETGKMATTGK